MTKFKIEQSAIWTVEGGDVLSELSRTTTAYHDATIDRLEHARSEYLHALRKFNAAQAAQATTVNGHPARKSKPRAKRLAAGSCATAS